MKMIIVRGKGIERLSFEFPRWSSPRNFEIAFPSRGEEGWIATPMGEKISEIHESIGDETCRFKIPIIFKINNQICISSIRSPFIRIPSPDLRSFN